MLVVLAFRTGQADVAFVASVERLAQDGEVTSVELGPLGPDAAAQLIEARGLAVHDGLYRESGGNPFYLLQLARGDPAGGPVAARADGRAGHCICSRHVEFKGKGLALAGI